MYLVKKKDVKVECLYRLAMYVFIILFFQVSAIAQRNDLYIIEAESALRQKDTSRAIAYFNGILDNDPQFFPAALRLAEIHFERRTWSTAATYANVALDILAEEAHQLTEPDYTNHRQDTAISLNEYHRYQKLKVDMASVLHLRAKVRMKQSNYHSAIADLDSAYGYVPFNADIQVDHGLALIKMGRIPEALNRLFLAIDIDPDSYKAYYNIGLLHLNLRDTTEAIGFFAKSIQLNDTLTTAMFEIAGIHMDRFQYSEAIEVYDIILSSNDRSIEALFRRGYAYSKTERYQEAIDDWDRTYRLDSSQIEAIRNAGLIHMTLKNYDDAVDDFTTYIQRLPGVTTGYLNRGYVHLLNHEHRKAIRDFEKIMELDPTDSSGYYYVGLVYAVRGKNKKACKYFSEALNRGYDKDAADDLLKDACK